MYLIMTLAIILGLSIPGYYIDKAWKASKEAKVQARIRAAWAPPAPNAVYTEEAAQFERMQAFMMGAGAYAHWQNSQRYGTPAQSQPQWVQARPALRARRGVRFEDGEYDPITGEFFPN